VRNIAIALVAACTAVACHTGPAAPEEGPAHPAGPRSGIVAGRKATDFTATDIHGNTVSLSTYLGKQVVLLDFYTTWCEPCVAELPHLKRLYEHERDNGFVIIAVAMDGPETIANVRGFVERNNVQFPMLIDDHASISTLYNPQKTAPFVVLIDSKGSVVLTRSGYNPGDEAILAKEVAGLLPRTSSSR
jgi:peroxiredoxin